MRDFSGKSPSPVSDEHLRAIGAIVVNWSALELVMELMILSLYEIEIRRGLILTSNLSFQNKLTILRVLATHGAIKDKVEARACNSLLDRIDKAHIKRNIVAHGWWAAGKVQGLAKRMAIHVRGRRLSTTSEQVPLSDLEVSANAILVLHADLRALSKRLGIYPDLPDGASPSPTPK